MAAAEKCYDSGFSTSKDATETYKAERHDTQQARACRTIRQGSVCCENRVQPQLNVCAFWIVSCSRKQPEQLRAHVTYSSCVHVSSDVAASFRFRFSERRIFWKIGPKFHPTNSPKAEFSRNSVKCHEYVIIYQSICSNARRKFNENEPNAKENKRIDRSGTNQIDSTWQRRQESTATQVGNC